MTMDGVEVRHGPTPRGSEWKAIAQPSKGLEPGSPGAPKKASSPKRSFKAVSTPKKLIGVELTSGDQIFKLPYKTLDPKTGLYEPLAPPLQEAVHWQAAQLGIEVKHLEQLDEAIGILFPESHQVDRVGSLEAPLEPEEAAALMKAHRQGVQQLKNSLLQKSQGAMKRHEAHMKSGELAAEDWLVNTLSTQALLSQRSPSPLPATQETLKKQEVSSRVDEDRASEASLSTAASFADLESVDEPIMDPENLAALVPDRTSSQAESHRGLLGRFIDFAAQVKQGLTDLKVQSHLGPAVQAEMVKRRTEQRSDFRSHPYAFFEALSLKGQGPGAADELFRSSGLQAEYLQYMKKSEEFRRLVHESASAVAHNARTLLTTLKAVWSPPKAPIPTTLQPVPMGLMEQVRNYFQLKQEGRAVVQKFKNCLDAGESVSKERLQACIQSDAEWFSNQLLELQLKSELGPAHG